MEKARSRIVSSSTSFGEIVPDNTISVISRMSGWHDQSMLEAYNRKTFKKLGVSRAYMEPRHGRWIEKSRLWAPSSFLRRVRARSSGP